MRKNVLFLLVLLVMSLILCFRFTTLAQTAEQQAQRVIEEDAARIYSSLSLYSKSDRRMFYKEFTPEIKSELWKIQLIRFPDRKYAMSEPRTVVSGLGLSESLPLPVLTLKFLI